MRYLSNEESSSSNPIVYKMKSSAGFRYLWLETGEQNSVATQSNIVSVNNEKMRNNRTFLLK
jgi:hypothetical protein